ncbi:MAG: hypothetical protein JW987_13445 [Anaerolineaceae bacterium]|nr:hypothetical protein [Anaerolineaceae bacterium]
MKLSSRTIADLSEIVCGNSGKEVSNFPYRSSSKLTRFFTNCDLNYIHSGETRNYWVEKVLLELNSGLASTPTLPSDSIIRVIQELLNVSEFEGLELDRNKACEFLNKVLIREGIEAYFDVSGRCFVRSLNSQVTSEFSKVQPRPLSASELSKRQEIEEFLGAASEDEIIEKLLVPMFRQLGFLRVVPTGHREKNLEFGKDIWMKYRLPTGHFIYFVAQVKKDKIDSAGKDINSNISGILSQARMALDYPVFDPETNRKHLVDHVYIISGSIITKPARLLLIEHLDKEARRHIIFMDRDEILDLGAITAINVQQKDEGIDLPF